MAKFHSSGFWKTNRLPYFETNSLMEKSTFRTLPFCNAGSEKDDENLISDQLDLDFKETIGQGSFTSVKRAIWRKFEINVAVKLYNKAGIRRFIKEKLASSTQSLGQKQKPKISVDDLISSEVLSVDKLRKLSSHPNILTFFQAFETKSTIYLLFEYTISGNLLQYLLSNGPVVEEIGKKWFSQMVSGLKFYHENLTAHRNINCENILFDSRYDVRIGDFGFAPRSEWSESEVEDSNDQWPKLGNFSEPYSSPEVYLKISHNPLADDVWACGIVLFCTIFGKFNQYAKILGGGSGSSSQQQEKAGLRLPRVEPEISKSCIEVFEKVFKREGDRIGVNDLANLDWINRQYIV